ncbi:SAV_2336 N-terminal domain-related protein [Spirillospora sp. NPDC048911]|uniref:SAV_2336 N-terminal domain-related protein n=1 Tax=Spirillospora sp. NPDC048911 TaxID=3364527 RepID=UPI003722DED4
MRVSVDRLKEALDAVVVDDASLTPRDLAELLWLACHLPAPAAPAAPPPEPASAEPPSEPPTPAEPPEVEPPTAPDSDPAPVEQHALHAPRPAPEEPKGAGQGVLVPTAPMLRHPLALQRALRPLKRRVPSPRRRILNEEATAARIADHPSSWLPVMEPAGERWLSLALVIDAAPAMRIWRPLVRELRDMLVRLGAFRDVRVWHLDRAGVRPYPGGPANSPASLVDPAGRQAVLLVSDCSGPDWWNGHIGPTLHLWAAHGPTAILQPLVERLWRRTAAPVVPGLATSSHPGDPNTALRFVPYEGRPQTGIPVPVLEIKPDWLADWARLVTASGGEGKPTAMTYVTSSLQPAAEPPRRERELPIEEQVARFYAAASTTAAELAAHVAVSVPALPVMRLIQQRLVPASRPGDLAEVLLSGLLQPLDAERGVYDFVPGAREALLSTLPRPESLATADVLTEVSAEIQARAGSAAEVFRAVMPAAEGTRTVADRPFALVSQEALRFLNHTAIPVRASPAERPVTPVTRVTRETAQPAWPLLATGADDGTLRIWDPADARIVTSWNPAGQTEASAIAVTSTSGRPLLVSGHANAALCVTDLTAVRLAMDNGNAVSALTTFRDATGRDVIASGGSEGIVRFWSPSTGAQIRALFHAHTSAIRAMTTFPDQDGNALLATGGDDGMVQIWDPGSNAKAGVLLPNQGSRGNAVLSLATFTGPGGRTILATGSRDGAVRLWYPVNGSQARAPLRTGKSAVTAIAAFTAQGRPLLVAGSGRTIRLWDPLERRPLGPALTGHQNTVLAVVAFKDQDGRPLIASIDICGLLIWDPLAGTQVGPVLEGSGLRTLAVLPSEARSELARPSSDQPATPQSPTSLLRAERERWRRLASHPQLASLEASVMDTFVTLTALSAPRDEQEATDLVLRVVTLPSRVTAADLANWLRRVCPPEDGDVFWGTLQPQHLAEALVAKVVREHPGFLLGLADALSGDQVPHALSVLDRVAVAHPEITEALAPATSSPLVPDDSTPRTPLADLVGRFATGEHRTPIGLTAEGDPALVNLKEFRHGLIAGGIDGQEVEVASAIVLGLAATTSPEALNVLLINRDGGTTFPALEGLPHLAAVPRTPRGDDIDHELSRLRDALLGELTRRRDAEAESLPRLLIVLEHFPELVRMPEFSDVILQIARARPSLGLHLLVVVRHPTQEALRHLQDFLSFRIVLRTATAAESEHALDVRSTATTSLNEVKTGLDDMATAHHFQRARDRRKRWRQRADSAHASVVTALQRLWVLADHPGTLAAISELQSLISTARSRSAVGGIAPDDIDPVQSALRAVQEAIAPSATSLPAGEGYLKIASGPPPRFTLADASPGSAPTPRAGPPAHQIVLPPLSTSPTLDGVLTGTTSRSQVVIGTVDRPLLHEQQPLALDLNGRRGNIAVVGSTGSGRSTLLTTFVTSLALTRSPRDVWISCLDFGNGRLTQLASLPHVDSVLTYAEPDRAATMIERITRLRPDAPQGFLVIDEWAELLRVLTPKASWLLTHLADRGVADGIHVVASATGWSQFGDARDSFGTRLELALADPAESLIDPQLAAEVPRGAPGRGITQAAEHFATALPRLDGRTTTDDLPEAITNLVQTIPNER